VQKPKELITAVTPTPTIGGIAVVTTTPKVGAGIKKQAPLTLSSAHRSCDRGVGREREQKRKYL